MSKFSVQGECTDKRTTKMCGRESLREFSLGGVKITPGAQYFLSRNQVSMWDLLRRYVLGNWGDLDKAAWYKTDEQMKPFAMGSGSMPNMRCPMGRRF